MSNREEHPMLMCADSWVRVVMFLEDTSLTCRCHSRPFNWLAQLYRLHVTDDRFRLVYRFRYYNDTKIFDSEDERSWTSGTVPADGIEDAVKVLHKLLNVMKAMHPHARSKVLEINGGFDVWEKTMVAQGFMHLKIEGAHSA